MLIDNELYWDGGILSNTPVEAVFDDYPRRSGLVFAVHVWNPEGRNPQTSPKSCTGRRMCNTPAAPTLTS